MRPRGELQFGMFRVLPSEGRLLYRGSAREITPKALQVLVVLLENQGHVVTDEELIRRVWGETLVNREKLSTTVSALRQAIGDLRNEGNEYRFVERISGKGYRFKAPVKILEPENIPGEAGNQRITTRVVYEQVEIEQDMAVSEAVPQVIVPQRGRVPGNASAGPPLVTTEGELERSKDGGGLLPMVRQETTTPTREPLIATGRLLSGVSGSGRSLRWWTWVIVGLAGVVTLAVIETHAKHISEGSIKPVIPPESRQLTHDRRSKELMQPLLTDGPRLFFTESEHDRGLLASVSVTGGDTLTIPAPPGLDLLDISPDKSQLLIATPGADDKPTHLCILPVTGGAVRALGIAATDAAWSPDGTEVAYAEHQNLFIASIDGSRARRLAAAPGPINWLRWSPDGTRLSFTIEDLQAETYSIWDVRVAQAIPRDILNGVAKPPHACCAEWTPDGNYLVFQARHEGRSDIWAIATSELEKEKVQPIRLTAGPLKYSVPVPSLDGKRLFAIGRENRGELMQFNLKSHEFTDYLSGVSGIEASFSRDGKWVAYVSYPEYELWRCRVDGTDALKLTSSDEREAAEPQWSPDGKRIAFMSVQSGKHFKAYVVPAAGGVPEPLIASGNEEGVPTWSPDGKSVVYGEVLYRKPASQMAIHLFDLRTRQLSTIPGSQGLWTPRWSPDGQYIVALAARDDASSPSMWLYSMKARKWALLAKLNDINEPAWAPKGDYIYFTTQNSNTNPALYRIRVPDHRLEKLADLSTIPLVHGCTSVTPDGSPLVVRDISSQEIYALDWNLH